MAWILSRASDAEIVGKRSASVSVVCDYCLQTINYLSSPHLREDDGSLWLLDEGGNLSISLADNKTADAVRVPMHLYMPKYLNLLA